HQNSKVDSSVALLPVFRVIRQCWSSVAKSSRINERRVAMSKLKTNLAGRNAIHPLQGRLKTINGVCSIHSSTHREGKIVCPIPLEDCCYRRVVCMAFNKYGIDEGCIWIARFNRITRRSQTEAGNHAYKRFRQSLDGSFSWRPREHCRHTFWKEHVA